MSLYLLLLTTVEVTSLQLYLLTSDAAAAAAFGIYLYRPPRQAVSPVGLPQKNLWRFLVRDFPVTDQQCQSTEGVLTFV